MKRFACLVLWDSDVCRLSSRDSNLYAQVLKASRNNFIQIDACMSAAVKAKRVYSYSLHWLLLPPCTPVPPHIETNSGVHRASQQGGDFRARIATLQAFRGGLSSGPHGVWAFKDQRGRATVIEVLAPPNISEGLAKELGSFLIDVVNPAKV